MNVICTHACARGYILVSCKSWIFKSVDACNNNTRSFSKHTTMTHGKMKKEAHNNNDQFFFFLCEKSTIIIIIQSNFSLISRWQRIGFWIVYMGHGSQKLGWFWVLIGMICGSFWWCLVWFLLVATTMVVKLWSLLWWLTMLFFCWVNFRLGLVVVVGGWVLVCVVVGGWVGFNLQWWWLVGVYLFDGRERERERINGVWLWYEK